MDSGPGPVVLPQLAQQRALATTFGVVAAVAVVAAMLIDGVVDVLVLVVPPLVVVTLAMASWRRFRGRDEGRLPDDPDVLLAARLDRRAATRAGVLGGLIGGVAAVAMMTGWWALFSFDGALTVAAMLVSLLAVGHWFSARDMLRREDQLGLVSGARPLSDHSTLLRQALATLWPRGRVEDVWVSRAIPAQADVAHTSS